MATAADAVTRGIEPVPTTQRRLGALDLAVLWGDLGVGLLVLVAGAFLVPGLGTGEALLAIVAGSAIGSALLGLAAYLSTDAGVPTMVLTRATLGLAGSALPTLLNVVQLIGWTSFELIVMAQLANALTRAAFGIDAYPVWAAFFAVFCTALALGGPLVVVRRWLERFAVWVMLLTTVGLFAFVATRYDLGSILAATGTGELSFWAGVDLVVSLPISWFPLVADYNRFAKDRGASFWGTFAGYFFANVAFFALGVLLVLALQTDPLDLNAQLVIALSAYALGWVALLIVLVDETDEGFADIYSAAVSAQNMLARVPQQALIVAVGAIGLFLAIVLRTSDYEGFLLLLGSVFVPLLAIIAAHHFIVRPGRIHREALFPSRATLNVPAIALWAGGFVLYQWISPTTFGPWEDVFGAAIGALHLPYPLASPVGATIPSFIAAAGLYAFVGRATRRRG
ncbi:MAG: cytosine permease [Chloroflexota bacterium]|nr:cytosine permease [Chloroflexota bacterium]